MRKHLISIMTTSCLLAAQMLPCVAQTLPGAPVQHSPGWTAPAAINHQSIWNRQSDQGTTNPTWHQWGNGAPSRNWSVPPSSGNTGGLSSSGRNNVTTNTGTTTHSTSGNSHRFYHHWNGSQQLHHHHHWDSSEKAQWLGVNGDHFWSGLTVGADNVNSNNSATQQNQHWGNPSHTWSPSTPGSSTASSQLNLNLSSTNDTTTGGRLFHADRVTIDVGGVLLTVTPNTQLTEAEKLAAIQVLQTGQQSLVLDAQGSADGGSVTIGSGLSRNLSSLVIPQGVTVIDLTRSGTINLAGNITDGGNLYVISLNPNLSAVSLGANNITVQSQGLLSDVLPAGSLSWLHGADPNLNFNLNAVNDIVNAGTISSGGALTLTTGGSIVNALPQGVTGAQPVIQAAKDVNLIAGSGNITNSGLIASNIGSINISAANSTTDINIYAAGGTFQALAGNINVRDASYAGSNNINLNGGDYLSQNLNLYSGSGAINGITGEISGGLNSQAGVEHLTADSDNLNLANNTVTGDPTFANAGSITISGPNSFGQAVSIVSGGSISLGNGTGSITTSGTAQQVIMISGATISFNGVTPTGTNITSSPSGVASNGLSVTLGTGSGNIDLSTGYTGSAAVITTTGGAVTLLADNGTVLFPTAATQAINTSNASGNGGNVTIIAGSTATGTPVIQAGNILTSAGGGNFTSGSVTLTTAAPQITNGGGTAFFNTDGSATTTSGGSTASTFGAGTTTAGAQVTTGNIVTAGGGGTDNVQGANAGAIQITAGGAVTTGALQAYGGGGGGGDSNFSGAGDPGAKGGNGAPITVTSISGDIQIQGDINASGGAGGGGGTGANGLSSNGANGGNGGNAGVNGGGDSITISTAGSVSITGPVLASGGGGGGGAGAGDYGDAGGGGGSFGGGGGGGGGYAGCGGGGYFGGGYGLNNGAGGGGSFGGGYIGGTSGNGGGSGGGTFGTGGTGGAGGIGGTGGTGGSIGSSGGNGGASGGGTGGTGGSSGASGTVSVTGSTVRINSTINSFYSFSSVTYGGQSANATGSGGTLVINATAAGSSFVVPSTSQQSPSGSNGTLFATDGVFIVGSSSPSSTTTTSTTTSSSSGSSTTQASTTSGGSTPSGSQPGTGSQAALTATTNTSIDTVTASNSSSGTTSSPLDASGLSLSTPGGALAGVYFAMTGKAPTSIQIANLTAAIEAADPTGTVDDPASLAAAYSTNAAIKVIVDSLSTSAVVSHNTLNFVTGVFENLFGRAPAASGLLFWSQAIDSGTITPGEAALSILAGANASDFATANARISNAIAQSTPPATPPATTVISGGSSYTMTSASTAAFHNTSGSAMTVKTADGVSINVPPGDTVYVSESGNDSVVYDFDNGADNVPVKVALANKTLKLSPGTQVLITKYPNEPFDSLLKPFSRIPYRNVRSLDAGNGLKAYICDFSIAQALINLKVIRKMLSSQDPAERKTAHRILKNATILADLTGLDYITPGQAKKP